MQQLVSLKFHRMNGTCQYIDVAATQRHHAVKNALDVAVREYDVADESTVVEYVGMDLDTLKSRAKIYQGCQSWKPDLILSLNEPLESNIPGIVIVRHLECTLNSRKK